MSYKVILRSKNRIVIPEKLVKFLEAEVGDILLLDGWAKNGPRVTIVKGEVKAVKA